MSDSIGSLIGRVAAAACLTILTAFPAGAQEPLTEAPTTPELLSRYDFTMSCAALSNPDDRFSWDAHWKGDFDLVDYVYGRATFLADYQALLGSEFRPFDPYQSNYTLEAAGSYRAGGTEIYGVLNHISRHLGDRPKRVAVAENSIGPRVMRRFTDGVSTVDLRVDLRKVIQRAYVDYTWMGDFKVMARHQVSPRVALYGQVYAEGIKVDSTVAGRNRQYGGRLEGGVRMTGTDGFIELFLGTERVIDADQLDRQPRRWAFGGFRLVTQ